MMKFNKINFGLLMLLFLCRFENILGTSDKNIEEGLKEKYKIFDLDGNILQNEKGEDFSFIVTCKYEENYYKYSKEIEADIEEIEKEKDLQKQRDMVTDFKGKNSVLSSGDIVKTNDGKLLVVKDSKKENKVYLVLGIYDEKNEKTANIFLDKNYNLQTYGPYDIIEENNTASVVIVADKKCGGVLFIDGSQARKFEIVYCKLKDVKHDVPLKKLGSFVEDSGCCDRLCNWCENLCP